jgi:NADP-reducing hydrogenase subunit HndD
MTIRKSHENPAVKRPLEEFLGASLSHNSHEIRDTHNWDTERKAVNKAASEEPKKVNVE